MSTAETSTIQQADVVKGRYLDRASGEESSCMVLWRGGRDFTIRTPRVQKGLEEVIVYADSVGRIAGVVVARDAGSFDIKAECSDATLDKVAKRFAWLRENRGTDAEQREDVRFVPEDRHTLIRLRGEAARDDEALQAQIVDVSRSGVSVATKLRPAVGVRIFVGKRGAEVVRLTDDGFAARFMVPIPAVDLGVGIRL